MQTISIAVSAILIAAGLVTAPGLILAARDGNAQTTLADVAAAEARAIAGSGSAMAYDNSTATLRNLESVPLGDTATRFIPAANVRVVVDVGQNGAWSAAARAAGSDTVWLRTSASSATTGTNDPNAITPVVASGSATPLAVNVPVADASMKPVPAAQATALLGYQSGGDTTYTPTFADRGVTLSAATGQGAGSGATPYVQPATPAAIAARPSAAFALTSSSLAVSADASASAAFGGATIASYAWAWGDGSTDTGRTAARTYAAAGTYTITLTITDSAGRIATTNRTVTVAEAPLQAAFSVTRNRLDVSVDASPSTGTVTSYKWAWGDGGTTTGKTARTFTYSYGSSGARTITLTLTGPRGSSTATATVNAISGTVDAEWNFDGVSAQPAIYSRGAGVSATLATDQANSGTTSTKVVGTADGNGLLAVAAPAIAGYISSGYSTTVTAMVYATDPTTPGGTTASVPIGVATTAAGTALTYTTRTVPLNTWTKVSFSTYYDSSNARPVVGLATSASTGAHTFYVDDLTIH